jgi:hypothetical protein
MNEGLFASWLGLPGIPREAEIIPLERDLRLAALTRSRYHAMSISVPESAEIIRAAKARGLNVTAGISINHLTLNETDIGEYRTFFRLSPPLRTEDDRRAMVSALADGDIDIIVSAHDPQDVDTKRLPFADAENGAIGLETLLAAALRLYHSGDVPLMRLVDAMSTRPARYSVLMLERFQSARVPISPCSTPSIRGCCPRTTSCPSRRTRPSRMPGSAAKYCKHWLQVSQFIAPECDLRALQPAFKGGRTRRA